MARPRAPVGAHGSVAVRRGDRAIAETGIRDVDGRVRHVSVAARSPAGDGVDRCVGIRR